MRASDRLRLGDLASVASGGGAPQDPAAFSDSGHPFIRAGSLSKLVAGGSEGELEHIEPEVARDHGLKLFPEGTILFAKSGMSATKGLIYCTSKPAYVVNHLAAIRPYKVDATRFIVHALHRSSPTKLIKDLAYPSIRLGDIAELEIEGPKSLDEQRRIAAILDKADALRRKRKRIVDLIGTVPQSLFMQMFGDPQANPNRWNKAAALSEVADIGSGITKGRKEPNGPLRAVPYLAVANVQDRALDLSSVKIIEASEDEIARFRLRDGDLVVTEGGDPDKLGRGTVWRNELPEVIHQNHIFRIRADQREVHPTYLNYLIGSRYGKGYFLRSAKQTTGIASINKSQLSQFPVLLPPLNLQSQFALELEKLKGLAGGAIAGANKASALFAALQHRAFSGQL